MATDWLVEYLKTTRNLCDISLILIQMQRLELLPTVLELLYEESQIILDEYCVESKQ